MSPFARHQSGASIVELMVSMAIGLVVIGAAIAAYLGSADASRMAEAQSRMNEDGQAALAILAQHIRLAGSNPLQPDRHKDDLRDPIYDPRGPELFAIRGCDTTFTNIDENNSTLNTLACPVAAPSAPATPNSIAITYQADTFNTVPAGTPPEPTDCNGFGLPVTTRSIMRSDGINTDVVPFYMADNRFYIAPNPGNLDQFQQPIPTLYCRGNGNQGERPLIENIEDMQIRYGAVRAGDVRESPISGYITAARVESDMGGFIQDRWNRVVAVRICVMVRSEQPILGDMPLSPFLDCQGQRVTPAATTFNPADPTTDRRLRRAYHTTVLIKNRRP